MLIRSGGIVTIAGGAAHGTGTFMIEAGPTDALTVTGTVAHDSLHLQIIFVSPPTVATQPDTAQFIGALTTPDEMRGMLTREGVTESVVFDRLRIGDPP